VEMSQSFEDFDICCLQEVFSGIYSENRQQFIACATKAGFVYHAQDP